MNYLSNKLAKVITDPTFPHNRKSSSVNPSSASIQFLDSMGNTKTVGACLRQQYYKMTGINSDASATVNIDWTISALIGDKLHDLIVQLIDTYGFAMKIQRLAAEHSIYDEVTRLSGRCDLIAWDYNTDEPIGIEIKSVGEYKAKNTIEQPGAEHVLQSMVYLDYYNSKIPDGQKKITKWYIWYISRTENWTLKAKGHGSPFVMLWDFCVELKDGVPIITLPTGVKQKWSQFSIKNIYERYDLLLKYVNECVVPPRDYEINYSEEKITGLFKNDKLERKMDKEAVEKWLKKGAEAGKLKVSMGDIECRFCEYSDLCWNGTINKNAKTFSNLPSDTPTQIKDSGNYFL